MLNLKNTKRKIIFNSPGAGYGSHRKTKLMENQSTPMKGCKSYKAYEEACKKFKIGETITFTRQATFNHPEKVLTGIIIAFNYSQNMVGDYFPLAHVKAACEYGSALAYNHTLHLSELRKIN